jgi:hypothetical protein
VAVGPWEAAAGGAQGFDEGGRGVAGQGWAVADGDRRRGDSSERAARRERADERMDADRLVVVGEEVADGAEDVGTDEQAAVGDPERRLVPAGKADDAAFLDGWMEWAADRGGVAGGDRVGVAAVAGHEDDDSGDGRVGQSRVEAG